MNARRFVLSMVVLFVIVGGLIGGYNWLTSSSDPLSVTYLGYTNHLEDIYAPSPAFLISNKSSRVIMRWAGIYAEAAPFNEASSPAQWQIVGSKKESYLKPGQSEVIYANSSSVPDGKWRLQVPWSTGIRARIALTARSHQYLPRFVRIAPQFYDSSNPVEP